MLRRVRWMGVWVGLGTIALALLTLLHPPVQAQSLGGLDSRIGRLEAENSALRSRVSRLEAQLSGGGGRGRTTPAPPQARQPVRSSDPMFDRLATLAIEQKERMDRLEARLAAIEARIGSPRR